MKITLLRTGGILPLTKKAEKEVDWSEEETGKLIDAIKVEDDSPGTMRDATTYQLMNNAGTFSIDLEKVPAKYKKTFEDLKDNLKVVKPG
ncbi:MAG: hypothetical protein JWQ40_1790 [Segetibacter sp.]|jgi:hypothetical protein|nr:hypothetical protein [Segetibacter sp.]